ncbi:MAG: aldo/keto reductase [Candidatus Hermodarchaeota archaeon]
MEFTSLGRTRLKVSVMGLGGGGPSRIGKGTGKTSKESITLIRYALDHGINIIDTAELYRTEKIVGEALKGRERESLILSTKKTIFANLNSEQVEKAFNKSLKALNTDYIDIYHLHAVMLEDYDRVIPKIIPTFQKLKEEGLIHFIGITERFDLDPQHRMLQRALQDDYWDVIMVGFNILNQTARDLVFSETLKRNIGTLIMFPVRLALSRPERLREIINELIENNQINPSDIDLDNPLDFLIHEGGAKNLVDAAYRFCNNEPGADVILSGTGNIDHLKDNIKSFSRPPLPDKDLLILKKIFKNVNSVSGQ